MSDNRHLNVSLTTATILKVLLVAMLFWFVFVIRDIIALLFIAFILSASLKPWVHMLKRRRIPRIASIAIIGVLFIGLIILSIVLIVPPLMEEVRLLALRVPDLYASVSHYFLNSGTDTQGPVVSALEHGLQALSQSLTQISNGVVTAISGVFVTVAATITILVVTFYLTVDEEGIKKLLRSVAPARFHGNLVSLMERVEMKMGSWFRGQLFLSLLAGVATFVTFYFLNVKFALILALLAAFFRIIPYIGPILAAVPAVLLGFSQGPWTGLGVAIAALLINQILDTFVLPKVMQHTVGLHPILMLIILLVGAHLGGMLGTILAVPAGAIVYLIVQERFAERRQRENVLHHATS